MTAHERAFRIAMLLDGKGGGRDISDDEVASWTPGDGLLWVDLDLHDRKGRSWLQSNTLISDNVAHILLTEETRPRSLVMDDGLVIIMRGINMNPGSVPDDMVAVRMWLGKDRIVTSRRRRVLSVKDVHDDLLAGRGPKSAGEFLVALTARLAVRIEAAVENIENMLESLGERLAEGDTSSVRTELGIVRRQAAAIRRHLSPQRDALDRLARNPADILQPNDVFDLREEGDHLTRHIEDLDLLRENALVTQEELTNRIAQEQNSRMYLLSVIAAVFLPLTFVTGLLGMNVAGLPGTINPNAFFISAVIMVFLSVALIAYFRFKRWI